MNTPAIQRLDRRLQRLILQQGRSGLHPVQEAAAPAILPADADIIIAAATAGGKTEAAFLPIHTHVASHSPLGPACTRTDKSNLGEAGVQVLAISPLKALINDQHRRLEILAEAVDLSCHRWHGDVPGARKQALLQKPRGILYITPESLEALYIRQGVGLVRLFQGLAFVVVDELHAFIGTVRGKQLQSLLHRLDAWLGRNAPRITLPATLGDMNLAAQFLRPRGRLPCHNIEAEGGSRTLKLQIKGVLVKTPELNDDASSGAPSSPVDRQALRDRACEEAHNEAVENIANHLFHTLRGAHNMVFANAKRDVEYLANALRRRCKTARVPNEFYAHHGSLAKAYREEAEAKLLDKRIPATAICTNTLEPGIDVGSVTSIAQLECPPSVAALRQRLGRSGRRPGEPSILRICCREEALSPTSKLWSQLRCGLYQAMAMAELLLRGW